jgi:hypothetical protein
VKQRACACPDRHNAKLACGYPMPCPHHTRECVRKIKVLVVVEGKKRRRR